MKQIGIYFILKYFIFFLISAIIDQNFSIFRIDQIKKIEDFFFYFWIILFFPILNFIVFSLLIYFSFKLKKAFKIIFNIIFIILEIFIFIYFTSQKITLDYQIILLFTISVVMFYFLFKNKIFINLNEN